MNTHFILIKHASESARGELLSASASCAQLLQWGFWPLYQRTRCRLMVKPGNTVLIYTAGQGADARRILAKAKVSEVTPWTRQLENTCPLFLDGLPVSVLALADIEYFEIPPVLTDHLDDLSFIPANRQKWGVSMMGGMRSISDSDYQVLTTSQRGAK